MSFNNAAKMKTFSNIIAVLAAIDAAKIGSATDSRVLSSSNESQKKADTVRSGYQTLTPQVRKSEARSLSPTMKLNPIDSLMFSKTPPTAQRPKAVPIVTPALKSIPLVLDTMQTMSSVPMLASSPPTNRANDKVENSLPVIDDSESSRVATRMLEALPIEVSKLIPKLLSTSPTIPFVNPAPTPANNPNEEDFNSVHEDFKKID